MHPVKMPVAETQVDVRLVRALLEAQHPDLTGPLREVGHGWDNVIFRLGDDLAVRLPRRAVAVPLIRHEQRWLSGLAPRLPIPVPVPVRVGVPGPLFGWPWSIVRWHPGQPLSGVDVRERRPYARPLGTFLARLHVPAPPEAPANPVRGIPLRRRGPAFAQHVRALPAARRRDLERRWHRLVDTPVWSGPPQWLHGDPHPGNVLVDRDAPVAVIDFGDLTAGDPATDLALGWLAFDAAGRGAFRTAYAAERPLDTDTWTRARGWALCLAVALLAHSDDAPVLAAVGRHALDQVLADEDGSAAPTGS